MKQGIKLMLKTYRIEDRTAEQMVKDNWESIVGKTIANRTSKIFFKDQKIYLQIQSSVLKQELGYQNAKIIALINEKVGYEFVKGIMLV